jgi:8-oxo-dGTP diphosphatase
MSVYKNPKPTVDLIIYKKWDQQIKVVLIKRKNAPIGWALPGGFVDEGEAVEDAARREGVEETGLHVELEELLYVYSNPSRDPRQHNISIIFTATISGDQSPVGMDDAAEAQWFNLESLPSPIVFDHQQVLNDFIELLSTGRRPDPEIGR